MSEPVAKIVSLDKSLLTSDGPLRQPELLVNVETTHGGQTYTRKLKIVIDDQVIIRGVPTVQDIVNAVLGHATSVKQLRAIANDLEVKIGIDLVEANR